MALEPCTPTNPNHHQYDSGCSSADRGTLGHLGNWTPGEIPYIWYIWQWFYQFGGLANLASIAKLMYTNTTYNRVYYEQCTLNITLFTKLKCTPMHTMSQFTKLIVHQIYHVYGINQKYWTRKVIFSKHMQFVQICLVFAGPVTIFSRITIQLNSK